MDDNKIESSADNSADSTAPSEKKPNGGKKKKRATFKDKCLELVRDKRPWHKRLITAALASLAFVYTLFIFGVLEVYIGNMSFYTFSLGDLVPPLVLLGVGIFAAMTLLLSLLRGRIFNYITSVIFSVTVCSYIQCNVIGYDLGSLDGSAIKWELLTSDVLINLAVWAVIFFIPFVIHYFNRKIWRRVVSFVSALLILMQTAGLVKLFIGNDFVDVVANGYLSNSTIYEVAPKKNVIVFLLDRFSMLAQNNVFSEFPDIKENLAKAGFTNYSNVCGSYSRTFPSVCYFLTGVKCEYDIPVGNYFKKAWTEGTFLKDIKDAGYDSKIYTEVNYVIKNTNNAEGKIDNIGESVMKPDTGSMLESMFQLSAYRYCPIALKPFFWCYTGDLEKITSHGDSAFASDIHSTDDPAFFANLKNNGISVKDDSNGSFIFYHMRGSHDPYVMDENGNRVEKAYAYQQTAGNLRMIFNYIDQLKQEGIYDDTTIIIMADHGQTGTIEHLDDMRSISLMVKPAGVSGGTAELPYNSAPLNQDNIRSYILKSFGIDYSAYGPAIDDIDENAQITRYFYMSGSDALKIHRDDHLVTYKIDGDINDFNNWSIEEEHKIEYPFYDAAS